MAGNEGSISKERALQFRLDALLKEAEISQLEMDRRLDRHAQSFYYSVLVLTGVVGAAFAMADKLAGNQAWWLLFSALPLLTTPLAAMFFDDEMFRVVTDHYRKTKLYRNIRTVLIEAECPIEVADSYFRCTVPDRFEMIKNWNQAGHIKVPVPRRSAKNRRLLFVLPFIVATFSIIWFWWSWDHGLISGWTSWLFRTVVYILVVLNLVAGGILWKAWSATESICKWAIDGASEPTGLTSFARHRVKAAASVLRRASFRANRRHRG